MNFWEEDIIAKKYKNNSLYWSFPKRGDWATHDAKWRGNWSPYIPRNIILRYSKEGDVVLDQFAGGGTTLVEAKLLNRDIIGVDVNDVAIDRCKEKVNFEHEGANGKVYIRKGIDGDLSQLKVKDFLEEMKKVAAESYRVLKKDKFCAVLMGDTRQKGCMIPMSFDVMKIFQDAGFTLKELIIKEQHNCKATGYWKTNSVKYNFLLIAHEYLFVFRKQI